MRKDQIQKYNYENLQHHYDESSLMSKKMYKVVSKINRGGLLLDIGCGTGELLDRVKDKFKFLYGVDIEDDAINFCLNRFRNSNNIKIEKLDIKELSEKFKGMKFDYITILDVLEHLDPIDAEYLLIEIYKLLKNEGEIVFTGPNWYEKIRIKLGKSPRHKFSYSSYGWGKMIERAGFKIISIETVDFPIFKGIFFTKFFHMFGICPLIIAKKQ